jgi:transaldolase
LSARNATTTVTAAQPGEQAISEIHALIRDGLDGEESGQKPWPSDSFWAGLRSLGSQLWLDTGDMEGASKLWTKELSGLTTNNTLLNAEVQKGIYDDVIRKAAKVLQSVAPETRVLEIAWILNARHGLRLARRFGGKVSVELHTALADDVEGAGRLRPALHEDLPRAVHRESAAHRGGPDRDAASSRGKRAGQLHARLQRTPQLPGRVIRSAELRERLLGRLGAYFADNKLGDGKMIGEKATLASQRFVKELSRGQKEPTLQIAASLRGASQVADLAGVDVFTLPLKVAEEAKKNLDGKWKSRLGEVYPVALAQGVDQRSARWETLWDVGAPEKKLAEAITARPPATGDELVRVAESCGARDLFPHLSPADLDRIGKDGKIPKHDAWKDRIQGGELAVDTLLNLAGLASFTHDQNALDDRIRRFIA